MADEINFDSTGVAPRTSPDPVPNGWYRAMVVDSGVKSTKAGTGKYLQLNWQILDGEHKGRIIWDRLNVENPDTTAQKIGQESLSAVCHVTGVLRLTHSSQLHNIPVMIKITIAQKDKKYEPNNEVKGYKPVDGAAPVVGTIATSPTATPAANAPAWAQKKTG